MTGRCMRELVDKFGRLLIYMSTLVFRNVSEAVVRLGLHESCESHSPNERVGILEWGVNRCIWGCTGKVCRWESLSRYGTGY
jgi:hypothetical protein